MSTQVRVTFIFVLCLFSGVLYALSDSEKEIVTDFIEIVNSNNSEELAKIISYPLSRARPLSDVENQLDFIERYHEIFDAKLISDIVNSDIESDWLSVGWRGIMLNNGQLWLDVNGSLFAVNHSTYAERKKHIEKVKLEKVKLHPSVNDFIESRLNWEFQGWSIRVDYIGSNNFRYVSWSKGKTQSDKPDLVLYSSDLIYDGTGGNHRYVFKNGSYKYVCSINIIGTEESISKIFSIYKGDKIIKSGEANEILVR